MREHNSSFIPQTRFINVPMTNPICWITVQLGAETCQVCCKKLRIWLQYHNHRIVKENGSLLNINTIISPDQTSVTTPGVTGVHLKRDALFLLISQRHNTRLHWRMLMKLRSLKKCQKRGRNRPQVWIFQLSVQGGFLNFWMNDLIITRMRMIRWHIQMYTSRYTCIRIHIRIYTYVYICIHMYTNVCICMRRYMYTCIHRCIGQVLLSQYKLILAVRKGRNEDKWSKVQPWISWKW